MAEINVIVADIAASAQEQATGLHEVNTAVNQMDQVTQQNAAMVEEATASSHTLSQETEELTKLVGRFQVGEVEAPRKAQERGAERPAARPSRPLAAAAAPRRSRSMTSGKNFKRSAETSVLQGAAANDQDDFMSMISRTMRDMLLLTLSDAGYRVIQAEDGMHGLEVLAGKGPTSSSPTSTCRGSTVSALSRRCATMPSIAPSPSLC